MEGRRIAAWETASAIMAVTIQPHLRRGKKVEPRDMMPRDIQEILGLAKRAGVSLHEWCDAVDRS